MRTALCFLFAACIMALALGAGAAEAEQTARDAFKRGIGLVEKAQYQEAAKAFADAYTLQPSWKILYNIGQCQAALKEYGLAIENFERYLTDGGDDVPRRTGTAGPARSDTGSATWQGRQGRRLDRRRARRRHARDRRDPRRRHLEQAAGAAR